MSCRRALTFQQVQKYETRLQPHRFEPAAMQIAAKVLDVPVSYLLRRARPPARSRARRRLLRCRAPQGPTVRPALPVRPARRTSLLKRATLASARATTRIRKAARARSSIFVDGHWRWDEDEPCLSRRIAVCASARPAPVVLFHERTGLFAIFGLDRRDKLLPETSPVSGCRCEPLRVPGSRCGARSRDGC